MGSRRAKRIAAKQKGRRKTPRRELVLRLLQKMPEKYSGVRGHSRLCEIAAEEIANQLRKKGVEIDPKFVSRAAFAHDAFKQLGAITKETAIAKNYFARKGFPEFAETLSATHALQKLDPNKLEKISLPKKIIIYCDNVCRGVPIIKGGKIVGWKNSIFSVEEAWKTVRDRINKGHVEDRQILGSNAREFVLTKRIERELVGMGLDSLRLIRKVRKKFNKKER